MGRLDEFSFALRTILKFYRWRRIDPVPWAPLRKPLNRSRLALVSSAGFTLPGQDLFDTASRGGDSSFRFIPRGTRVASLHEGHGSDSFDHGGMRQDPNLAFPLDRVEELAASGRIGSVNGRHLSMMGAITAPGKLVRKTAPETARALQADGVDAALLVPVGPFCNQAVSLVAAELERRGISTVALILLRAVAERVRPPRALAVPFPHGYPLDRPDSPSRQHAVIEAALRLLERADATAPVLADFAAGAGRTD